LFDDHTAYPMGALVQGSDGKLYGTTSMGGDYGFGSIFQLTTNGTITIVASFNGDNGNGPAARLFQDADGSLYGTTQYGGANGFGAVFRLALSGSTGTIIPLVSFSQTNGSYPEASLIQDNTGVLYGTTSSGG